MQAHHVYTLGCVTPANSQSKLAGLAVWMRHLGCLYGRQRVGDMYVCVRCDHLQIIHAAYATCKN